MPGRAGGELRALMLKKYGRSYDMSFVRRDFPLGNKVGLHWPC